MTKYVILNKYNTLYRILYLAIFLIIFLGINVLRYFGYMIGDENSPSIQKIFPSFYIMLPVTFLFLKYYQRNIFISFRHEFYFIFFIVILFFYVTFSKLTGAISFLPNTIILPVFFSICLKYAPSKFKKSILNLVISFLVINSCIAIWERLISYHFFEPSVANIDFSGFRSSSLQNHPLNNALFTTIIIGFLLAAKVKLKNRVLYILLGLIALICYGARSALAATILVILLEMIRVFLFNRSKTKRELGGKIVIAILLILSGLLFYYLVLFTPFGERLVSRGVFDESAQVRLSLFSIFNFVDNDSLIWGGSFAGLEDLKDNSGVFQIENFWIIWILRFGLIFGSFFIISFVFFVMSLISAYGRFQKLLLLITFIGVATSNNSLAGITGAFCVFVICSIVFNEPINKKTKKVSTDENRSLSI